MSFTDPNQNQNPPSGSGWASRASGGTTPPGGVPPYAPGGVPPYAPGGVPPLPPGNGLGSKAKTIVGGIVPRLIGAAVSIALAFAAYWFFVVHKNSSDVADTLTPAGKCFSYVETTSDLTQRSCTDPLAEFKSEGSSTANSAAASKYCDSVGAYVQIEVSISRRNDTATGVLCGALNLKVGDCATSPDTDAAIVACTTTGTDVDKVLALKPVASAAETLSDAKARAICPSLATSYLSDTVGKTIVCLGKP